MTFKQQSILTVLCLCSLPIAVFQSTISKSLSFPKSFIFSTATASYQVEGGWNASGKGENIWDRMVHRNPSFIKDGSNGDIACDSFHKFKEDVQNIKRIGFKMYRFSISWSRVLPDGTIKNINQLGVKYYNDLIDELLVNGVQPMVTLHHWDVPQPLQEIGGWLNSSMVQYFEDYAKFAFSTFGNKVKWWITINEPLSLAGGYGGDSFAPALLKLHGVGEYIAAHNLIKAHAKAYRLYEAKYKKQGGKISLAINGFACFPKTTSLKEDEIACDRSFQFQFGWFAHPIFSSDGDYPPIMRKLIDENSAKEGLANSRLPRFTEKEIKEIKGTFDYFALNHYSTNLCTSGQKGPSPSWNKDSNIVCSYDKRWPSSKSSWLKVVPKGFRWILNKVKQEYNNPTVFVTENGFSDYNKTKDFRRIFYYEQYLAELQMAIDEDECDVIGYTVWSLMDNFEWRSGYTECFGLIQVDFNDPNRPRKFKESAQYFHGLLKQLDDEDKNTLL